MKRPTKRGIKTRVTRRRNQVRAMLSDQNIGANTRENVFNLLTKDIHTKRGLARSKRMEQLLYSDNPKDLRKLLRYGDFSNDSNYEIKTLTRGDFYRRMQYGHWRDSQSAFMATGDNEDIVNAYNNLTPEEKSNRKHKAVRAMDKAYGKYSNKNAPKLKTIIEKIAEYVK